MSEQSSSENSQYHLPKEGTRFGTSQEEDRIDLHRNISVPDFDSAAIRAVHDAYARSQAIDTNAHGQMEISLRPENPAQASALLVRLNQVRFESKTNEEKLEDDRFMGAAA